MADDTPNTLAVFFGHASPYTYLFKPEALNVGWALPSLRGAFKDPDDGATPKTN